MKNVGVVYPLDTKISEEDREKLEITLEFLLEGKNMVALKQSADYGSSLYLFLENVERGHIPTLNDLRWHQKDCELRIIGIK